MFYTIKGKVTGKDNLPLRRRLFAYNRETGDLISDTYSDFTTGEYTLNAYTPNPVMVICQPLSGETLNAIVYDNVTPIQVANDNPTGIGKPGQAGFGVGVAGVLPEGITPLPGHDNPYSENYGNYQYTDGSIMVFIPAFYLKWGDGANGVGINKVLVKDYSEYPNEAAANADGFALHRAFIDDGQVKTGFFFDKYLNGKHPTMNHLASLKGGRYMHSNDNTLVSMGFTQNASGLCDATKLRGTGFHTCTAFAYNAIQALSLAHGQSSVSKDFCEWYGTTNNFPRGNDNNSAIFYSLKDSTLRGYRDSNPGGYNIVRAGTCSVLSAVTHNGQLCGVADLAGNVEEMSLGFTVISNEFRFQKESVKTANIKVSASAGDVNSFINAANYDSMGVTLPGSAPSSSIRFRSNAQVNYPNNTDKTSVAYKMNMIGLPGATVNATDETNPIFGGGVYFQKVNSCLIGYGLSISTGAAAGIWGVSTGPYTAMADYSTGVRTMLFP